MKQIKETIKRGSQYIIKYEDNKAPVFVTTRVVAGLSWPTAEKDGYFCIMAEESGKPMIPEIEHRPITVLAEDEGALLPALFDKLGEQLKRCSCTNVYAQFNPAVVNKPGFDGTNKAFVAAFNDYKGKRPLLRTVRLQPPLISDWLVGILTVQKWRTEKALEIPRGSIMHGQLKSMIVTDRKQKEQDRFPAMVALVCAMTPFVSEIVVRGEGLRKVVPAKYAW